MYYTIGCILCALFSSSKRTVDARITLFTILSLNVIIERMLVKYYDNVIHHPNDKVMQNYILSLFRIFIIKSCIIQENLISTTWMYRKIALTLCAVTLLLTYYYYKDEQIENYKALKRIEHQLNTIQEVTSTYTSDYPFRMYINCI